MKKKTKKLPGTENIKYNVEKDKLLSDYTAYKKPTAKKIKEIEAEKIRAKKIRQANLKTIESYLKTRTGSELMGILKKSLEDDFLKNGEMELLRWARKEKIIMR